jgi:hypothetical protein
MGNDTSENMEKSSRLETLWESSIRFTVSEMKEVLKADYQNIKSRKWTKCMIGESGIGKTWLCKQVAGELGIDFETLVGSGLASEDIRGFPMPVRKLSHNGYKSDEVAKVMADYYTTEPVYQFQLLDVLSKVFSPNWKGILLLDEWAQAPKEVQDVFFQIIYDRKMDNKRLSDDVMILSAMNPPYKSEYMVSRISQAAEDRFEFYVVDPTVTEWIKWARNNNIDRRVIDFVTDFPGVFTTESGRRLHNLSDKISKYSINAWESNISGSSKTKVTAYYTIPILLRKEVSSIIKPKSADLFIKHVSKHFLITGSAILSGNNKVMEYVANSAADSSRIIHFHRVHKEILLIVEYPETYMDKNWKKLPNDGEGMSDSEERQFNMEHNWTPLVTNLLEYMTILSETSPDTVMALLKSIVEIGNSEFENVFNKMIDTGNDKIKHIVLRTLSYPQNPEENILENTTELAV